MIGIYFSGTGNTKYCLTRFLDALGDKPEMYSITDEEAIAAIQKSTDIIFAYPTQYSNLPKIVRDFINSSSSVWAGKKIYIIVTMGLFSGDGAGLSARLFKKYGATVTGGLHVRMPDCIGDVKALKKPLEENKAIVAGAQAKIKTAAKRLLDEKPTKEGLRLYNRVIGLFGQRLYFGHKVKNYTKNPKIDAEKCIGCGKCEELCPMKSIHVENGKAVAGNMCTMCYRCFSNCPLEAIMIIGNKIEEQVKIEKYL